MRELRSRLRARFGLFATNMRERISPKEQKGAHEYVGFRTRPYALWEQRKQNQQHFMSKYFVFAPASSISLW
jgi:hypothetical protein